MTSKLGRQKKKRRNKQNKLKTKSNTKRKEEKQSLQEDTKVVLTCFYARRSQDQNPWPVYTKKEVQ